MAQDVPPPSFGGLSESSPPAPAKSPSTSGGSSPISMVLMVIFGLYVLVSAYFLYDMHSNLSDLQKKTADQATADDQLKKDMKEMQSRNRAATDALADKLGMTEKELDEKSTELQKQQRAAEARLQKQQQEQMQNVTGQVQGVQQDVNATKTDLSATKTDLADTKAKLESMRGDMGVQSGLIARTRDDLEELKRRGERNYFEFTLVKGAKKPTVVSTVSLALKKVDPKKSKFTMNVMADDKTIEKKDKNMGEPVQFYTGKDRKLYELVVFEMTKNQVSGYLSTPKQ